MRTTFLFRRTEEDSWSFTAKQRGSPLRLRKLPSAVSNPCLGNVQPSCDSLWRLRLALTGELGSPDYISKKVADEGRGMKFSVLFLRAQGFSASNLKLSRAFSGHPWIRNGHFIWRMHIAFVVKKKNPLEKIRIVTGINVRYVICFDIKPLSTEVPNEVISLGVYICVYTQNNRCDLIANKTSEHLLPDECLE